MLDFARTAESIRATSSKLEKTRLLAEYLRTLDSDQLRLAPVYLTGRPFSPKDPRTLNLGWAGVAQAVERLSGLSRAELSAVHLKHSDLGDWAEEALQGRTRPGPLDLTELDSELSSIEASDSAADRVGRLEALLARLDPLAAKYVVKILSGEVRIGLQEGLVEEGIAAAYGAPPAAVRRAHMLTGDLGETAALAAAGELTGADVVLGQPVRYMLATAVAGPDEALMRMGGGPVWTEEKYDGVRCQLHRVGSQVRLFSRDLRETTAAFPEVVEAGAALGHELIVDGEILAHREGRVLRFFELQRRLGRKVVSQSLRDEVPVVLVVFDLLHLDGRTLLEEPLRDRRRRLEDLGLQYPFLLARYERAETAHDLERIFKETRERGNEGLMLKDPDSGYSPGRRGLAWLKLKRPLATLDVVVTAVEWGHGKRRGVLSDYTFAVRDEADGRLVNVGKAYTGLTDAEIATMTQHFLGRTVVDQGRRLIVEPETVVEVAFDSIQRSGRHASGFALRFPRILRLRDDKRPDEIDTLAQVSALYDRFFGADTATDLTDVAVT